MLSPQSTAELKASLRQRARERRAQLTPEERATAAGLLRDRFLSEIEVPPKAVVSGYWPIEAELDIRPLLRRLAADGCSVALPVVEGRGLPLRFLQWREDEPLDSAGFGLMQPHATAPALEPDLLLVPLLAFDRQGDRLGYGAGYYDLTLAALRRRKAVLAVGVAFAAQEVERVPREPWDEPLDWIVTERFAMRIGAA
jgi:5-formyltetrahydrofolate cyclo-ligase